MSVAKQAARGVAWNMLLGVSSRMLQLVGTLVLTRFIAPDEYGAVLTASIAVLTAGVLTSFAFGQHIIAKKAPPHIAFQAMVVHVALGLVAMLAVYLVRDPLGDAFDSPHMGSYLYAYAIAHLLDRVRYVPERLLMRALRFRTIAAINASGEVAFTAASLLVAQRWGANAIVFGVLVRAVLTFVLFLRLAPRAEWLAPTRLRAADVKDLFSYGLPIMIAAVADRAATRWDNLIMSKLFDPGVMGRYNLSYSLAEMPVNNIAEQIGEVLMPSFSRMEDAQRRRAVVRAPMLMGVIVSPLGVGLGAVSSTVVATFFDERWQGMGPMLAILSTMTVFRPMTWSAIAYCQAVQQTRIVMISSFLRAIVVLSLVALFGWLGGPLWACVGAGIGYALHSVVTIIAAGRLLGFPVGEYLVGVARPLLPCIPMFFAVVGVEHALVPTGLPLPVILGVQLVTGAVVYIISAFVLVRPAVDELLRLGRETLRRRRS
ncbi:MAG TPA: oligosaccharide flippase family protein [Kofleriaceae bacterium]|nr:oligosaccharide flippase family protein [Kofleriaceae bacterium]